MIDGIEILSQCVKTSNPVPLWLCIVLLIPIIISIIGLIISIIDSDDGLLGISMFGIIAFFVISCLCWDDHFNSVKQQYTEYKVTISDSVNFNEFNDKYEILEQDGKIYIIREKEVK